MNWSVVAYYWLDRDLVVIHGNAQGLHVHVRSLSRLDQAALEMCTAPAPERRTLAFQNQLYGDTVPSPVSRNYRRRLYDLLIPPQVTLDPDRCLAIIPHGRLHYLPFHALENDAGFLVQQTIPFYAPSLRTLQGILERADHYVDPVVKVLLVSVNTFPRGRSPLQWTSSETSRLSELYGKCAILLDNAEATIDTLREWSEQKTLCRFSLLHFATHADLDVASGALSGIALWDADLTAEEVSRLRLGPAIVVLSACQSGLSEIQAGDELFGLPYAFFVAGAQSVVASLWHVSDEHTAGLMFTLHHLLDQGESPAHALARTQRLAIQQGLSPYVWGAFTAMGAP
jgi:CHAT domain-containing protein